MPTQTVTMLAERIQTISRNMCSMQEHHANMEGNKASRKDKDNIQEYGAPCRNIMPTRRVQSQQKGHRQYPRIWCSMQEHHANTEGTKPAERTQTISRNMLLHAGRSCQHGGYKASRKDTDNIQEYGAPCRNIMPTWRVTMLVERTQTISKNMLLHAGTQCQHRGQQCHRKDRDNIQEYEAPCRNIMPTWRATMPVERTQTISMNIVLHAGSSCQHGG